MLAQTTTQYRLAYCAVVCATDAFSSPCGRGPRGLHKGLHNQPGYCAIHRGGAVGDLTGAGTSNHTIGRSVVYCVVVCASDTSAAVGWSVKSRGNPPFERSGHNQLHNRRTCFGLFCLGAAQTTTQ